MPTAEERADALLKAPAGCVLLLIAEEHNLTPADLARPEIGLFAIAEAVEQISPWNGAGHDRVVRRAISHRDRLRERALALAGRPGISWWWEPIDRDRQLWLPQESGFLSPEETPILRPRAKPDRKERYVHEPRPLLSTSNAYGALSPELAHVLVCAGDWNLRPPIDTRHVKVQTHARVLEINSAQEWHDLVRRYPADGFHISSDDENLPWGRAHGLMVPDWRAVSYDWDGVHITPWAYLTANQIRVTSDIGWTEPWAWESAHTIWLDWMFDSVEDLPPVEANTFHVPHVTTQALNFSDPAGWMMGAPTPRKGWPMQHGITREPFGEIDGQAVEKITLSNDEGMSVSILTYGGIIQSLQVPDRRGDLANVVLGFDNLADYVEKSPYFGAVVGRFANRIANGRFSLNGREYTVPVNNGPNSLHGGLKGFDRHIWDAEVQEHEAGMTLILRRTSPDREEGYPGSVDVTVSYMLWTNANGLAIQYYARSDAPTVINLSNHSYFNLAGEGSGDILRHVIQLRASQYVPINANLIPTGDLAPVVGTPFDFTDAHIVGERIDTPGNEQLANAGGYDHCWVLDDADELGFVPEHNVRMIDPSSGRLMDISTDQPGVQFYSGNFLDGSFAGTSGKTYGIRSGFCLETQHFPDSPNQPQFPSTVLEPGERGFSTHTTFSFGVV